MRERKTYKLRKGESTTQEPKPAEKAEPKLKEKDDDQISTPPRPAGKS
jgi:hypothetical protein